MPRAPHTLAALTFVSALIGCPSSGSPRPEEAEELGRITGIVLNVNTGQPIPHAVISIGGDSASPYHAGARTTSADSAGAFRFDSISFGTVWVLGRFIGYHAHVQQVYVRPGEDLVLRVPLDTTPLTIFNDTF